MRLLFEIKDALLDAGDLILNKEKSIDEIPDVNIGQWYGPFPSPEHINQLANPDPELIEEHYGTINDSEAAQRFGARNIQEYSYWAWRSCAIGALASVLKANGTFDKNNLHELVREALLQDGYAYKNLRGATDIGWKHKVIAQMAESRGHIAEWGRYKLHDILGRVYTGSNALISVSSERGGHMVVIKQFRQTEKGQYELDINDPYIGHNEEDAPSLIDLSEISEVYLGKAIIIS